MSLRRIVLASLGVVALGGVFYLMREAFMTTQYDTGPDTRTRVVVDSRTNRAESNQTRREYATAQLITCRLEVVSDPVAAPQPVAGHPGRFEVVLAPALDSSDRKQFEGCIEDWVIDHHLLEVVTIEDLPADHAGSTGSDGPS